MSVTSSPTPRRQLRFGVLLAPHAPGPELASPDAADATRVTAASGHKVPGVKLEVRLKAQQDPGGLTVTQITAVAGTPLSGVASEVMDASGAVVTAGKAGIKGVWQGGDGTVGTYAGHEAEAAEGCQLSAHQKVTVTADKTTSATGNDVKVAKVMGAATTLTLADGGATNPDASGNHAVSVTYVLGPGGATSEALRIPALGETWDWPAYESAAHGGSS